MPPVLIPVAVAVAAGGAAVALGATTITLAAISVGATAVAAGIGYLNQPKKAGSTLDVGAGQAPEQAPANIQRDIAVRQAVPARRYVYGSCKVGGVVFFQDNLNPIMYSGILLTDGVATAIDKVFFGSVEVPLTSGAASVGSVYYTRFSIEFADGDPSQAASVVLTGAFSTLTSDFRQRGVARVVCSLDYGADEDAHAAMWSAGVTPTFVMRGVKVHDPRDLYSVETDEGTWSYSANPALAVAHALTHAWGVSLNSNDIDWDSVAECASLCDELMTYDSASVATFEIAGLFQAGADMASQLTAMLACFGGTIIDVDGKIGLRMDGERSSVWTITDDDIVEFGEYAAAGDYATTYNAIKAIFFNADSDGAEATTPVYEMAYEQAIEGLRETSIDLRFAAKTHSAQILAFRELMRSRAGRRLSLTLSDAALFLQALDRVTIASTDASFINGDYEVVQIDLAQFGAIVQLREYPTAAYADPSTYLQ